MKFWPPKGQTYIFLKIIMIYDILWCIIVYLKPCFLSLWPVMKFIKICQYRKKRLKVNYCCHITYNCHNGSINLQECLIKMQQLCWQRKHLVKPFSLTGKQQWKSSYPKNIVWKIQLIYRNIMHHMIFLKTLVKKLFFSHKELISYCEKCISWKESCCSALFWIIHRIM